MSERTGEQLGPYTIVEKLGTGAAGAAYRAKHSETGEEVAVKVVHARHGADQEVQNRFVREVTILERLHHPNVVGFRDCGVCDEGIYVAMELVDSGTLSQALRARGRFPWRDAVEVAIQVCDALEHASQHGVVHRDLKPANLFLSSDGKVKVGDFGLARDNQSHRLTVSGQTVGTRSYMAPEQIRGADELTGAVDLYALGCLLFEMVAGRSPYSGATPVEVMEAHLFAPPPRLDAWQPDAPPELSELVARLLAKDPADRGGSADAVRVALDAILAGRPMPELALPPRADSANGDGAEPAAPAPPRPNLTERLRTPAPAAAAPKPNTKVLIVLGVIAVVAIAAIVIASR